MPGAEGSKQTIGPPVPAAIQKEAYNKEARGKNDILFQNLLPVSPATLVAICSAAPTAATFAIIVYLPA